jgi:hypothetical protein
MTGCSGSRHRAWSLAREYKASKEQGLHLARIAPGKTFDG